MFCPTKAKESYLSGLFNPRVPSTIFSPFLSFFYLILKHPQKKLSVLKRNHPSGSNASKSRKPKPFSIKKPQSGLKNFLFLLSFPKTIQLSHFHYFLKKGLSLLIFHPFFFENISKRFRRCLLTVRRSRVKNINETGKYGSESSLLKSKWCLIFLFYNHFRNPITF
jgi:hypothetical protein